MLNITRLLGELGGAMSSSGAARPMGSPPQRGREEISATSPHWRHGLSWRPERSGEPPVRHAPAALLVVVWNLTRQCNLFCQHCYASAAVRPHPDELGTAAGAALVDDLARAGVASLVLSGGEPLLRADALPLARRAADAGLSPALSSNGTLIDGKTARALREAGVGYVGVSIDGIGALHDRVRGMAGAYEASLNGLRRARDAGLRVGLRFTLSRATVGHLDRVLDLMEAEQVDRGYVSHLVCVGRARRLSPSALTPGETRQAVERLFDRAERWRDEGRPTELVTGNNDADGVALYLRLRLRGEAAAACARRQLAARGGNASGVAIANVDARGDVHPDQFWPHVTLGNVRERPLSAIWSDPSHPVLAALRDRRRHLGGRCPECPYFPLCGGGNRVRAEMLTGDRWAPDPGCHLTGAELDLSNGAGRHERSGDEAHPEPARGRGADHVPRDCADLEIDRR